MPITNYKQDQGPLSAGTPGRFGAGRQGLTFVNPVSPQVDNYDVTTGDAADWSITVTNDGTLASITHEWTGSATIADVVSVFIASWNADPNNLVFARASAGADATEFNLTYADGGAYTAVVTPGGAGAGSLTSAASSNFNQGFGLWAFRPLTAAITNKASSRRLINPLGASNVLENCAGVAIKTLNEENPERHESSTSGFYRPGRDVPLMRRGYIWVPVTVAVKPGQAVHAIIVGSNAGKTTNTGALDLSSIASFISVAAAGETAEIELTLA